MKIPEYYLYFSHVSTHCALRSKRSIVFDPISPLDVSYSKVMPEEDSRQGGMCIYFRKQTERTTQGMVTHLEENSAAEIS